MVQPIGYSPVSSGYFPQESWGPALGSMGGLGFSMAGAGFPFMSTGLGGINSLFGQSAPMASSFAYGLLGSNTQMASAVVFAGVMQFAMAMIGFGQPSATTMPAGPSTYAPPQQPPPWNVPEEAAPEKKKRTRHSSDDKTEATEAAKPADAAKPAEAAKATEAAAPVAAKEWDAKVQEGFKVPGVELTLDKEKKTVTLTPKDFKRADASKKLPAALALLHRNGINTVLIDGQSVKTGGGKNMAKPGERPKWRWHAKPDGVLKALDKKYALDQAVTQALDGRARMMQAQYVKADAIQPHRIQVKVKTGETPHDVAENLIAAVRGADSAVTRKIKGRPGQRIPVTIDVSAPKGQSQEVLDIFKNLKDSDTRFLQPTVQVAEYS